MKILFLTQIIPYPPNAGPRVKTWHVLRYLASRGHAITLVSYVRPEEVAYLPEVAKVCHTVHTVPIVRSRPADVGYWLKSHLSGRPFLIERDDLPPMRQLVRPPVGRRAVRCRSRRPADDDPVRPGSGTDAGGTRPFTIFDAHNATWTIWQRMRQTAPAFLRNPSTTWRERRLKAYEGMLVRRLTRPWWSLNRTGKRCWPAWPMARRLRPGSASVPSPSP
jgi:polysaccharide biosynthesis protein PslH